MPLYSLFLWENGAKSGALLPLRMLINVTIIHRFEQNSDIPV